MSKNDRGFILRLKLLISEKSWRMISRPIIRVVGWLPSKFLYYIGYKLRVNKMPYSFIGNGDLVVQVGAPRDLLAAGRSRAIYFMKSVGHGTVIVFEPDPLSAKALSNYVKRHTFDCNLILIEKGAWSSDDELKFYSSPLHPASNVIEGAYEVTEDEITRRNYQEIRAPVTTIDSTLKKLGLVKPKLVSITANGSEREILNGMENTIKEDRPYISLAITGEDYPKLMKGFGYSLEACDDRGFTFAPK